MTVSMWLIHLVIKVLLSRPPFYHLTSAISPENLGGKNPQIPVTYK